MDEGRDARLAFSAGVLLVIMIAGQTVLLVAHLWVPMVGATEWLLREDEPLIENVGEDSGAAAPEAPATRPGWWLSAAIASAGVAAGLVGLAAFMLRGYTVEVRRWRWNMALGGLATVWGLLVAWMIWRSSQVFAHALWGGG